MNDEIKEILNNLRYTAKKHTIQVLENGGKIEHCPQEVATEMRINTYSAKLLLDYITNLQQAVKNTKETADDMLYELNEENEKLKSRIEKAVEYIKINFVEDFITVKTLLNILNGRSG